MRLSPLAIHFIRALALYLNLTIVINSFETGPLFVYGPFEKLLQTSNIFIMSQVPVLPPNSKFIVQPESTTKKLPSLEEYNAILEQYPQPTACEVLYCIWHQSEEKTQFEADINAGGLVEKPYETREAWYASINHASNSA